MGKAIVKLGENEYVEWSTVVDAPISYVLTRDELRQWIEEEYGRQGLERLPGRLALADEHGHSFATGYGMSLDDVLEGNRAGPNETELSLDEIRQAFRFEVPPNP